MKRLAAVVVLGLMVHGAAAKDPPTVAPTSDSTPESRWARTIAASFLDGMVTNNGEVAGNLMSASFRKSVAGDVQQDSQPAKINEWVQVQGTGLTHWTIESEETSPAKDAVSFRGTMTGDKEQAPFTIIIASEAGKWHVDSFSEGLRTKAGAKKE